MTNLEALSDKNLGRYVLKTLIGRGGMSVVYRAYDLDLERDVAFKILADDYMSSSESSSRFIQEAKTIARLEHSHIVPIYDFGSNQDVYFIVMRLLLGGSLEARLNQQELDLADATQLLDQVAKALDYAHTHSVIHRDIKASNVLIDQHRSFYLADFGVAKLMNVTTALTMSGKILGTPSYMAPELWRDEDASPATDIYALGALMYRVLGGKPPFEAASPMALMRKHLYARPESLHLLRPELPVEMDFVVERALAKNPADRYPDAKAFATDFMRAAQRSSILAHDDQAESRSSSRPPSIHATVDPASGESTTVGVVELPGDRTALLTDESILSESAVRTGKRRISPRTITVTGISIVALLVALVLLYLSRSAPPPSAAWTPTNDSAIPAILPSLSPTFTPTMTTTLTSPPSATPTTSFSTPLPATLSQSTRVIDVYPTFSTTNGMVTPAFQNFSGTMISTSPQHFLIVAWQAGQVRTLCVESRVFRPQFQLIPPAGAPTSSVISDSSTACIVDYVTLTTGDYVIVISAPNGTSGNYQLTITAYGACAPQLPLAVVRGDDSVLLRERATQFSQGVGTAAPNQCFAIVGQNPNGDYWQLRTSDGTTGWIVADAVRAVGTTDSVPILNE